jgi:hypothetical protein
VLSIPLALFLEPPEKIDTKKGETHLRLALFAELDLLRKLLSLVIVAMIA